DLRRASCGYWAIGRVGMAMAPAMTVKSASTVAKTGRLMKKLTNMATSLRLAGGGASGLVGGRGGRLVGRDRGTVAQLLDSGGHDLVAGGEAGADGEVI